MIQLPWVTPEVTSQPTDTDRLREAVEAALTDALARAYHTSSFRWPQQQDIPPIADAVLAALAAVPAPTDEGRDWSAPKPSISGVCGCCGQGPDDWCAPNCSADHPLWPPAVPASAPTGETREGL